MHSKYIRHECWCFFKALKNYKVDKKGCVNLLNKCRNFVLNICRKDLIEI